MVRTLLVSSIVVATVAGIDAVRGDHWDQVAMLLILGSLSAISLAVDTRRAPSVRLRPDLLAWVEARHRNERDRIEREFVEANRQANLRWDKAEAEGAAIAEAFWKARSSPLRVFG